MNDSVIAFFNQSGCQARPILWRALAFFCDHGIDCDLSGVAKALGMSVIELTQHTPSFEKLASSSISVLSQTVENEWQEEGAAMWPLYQAGQVIDKLLLLPFMFAIAYPKSTLIQAAAKRYVNSWLRVSHAVHFHDAVLSEASLAHGFGLRLLKPYLEK